MPEDSYHNEHWTPLIGLRRAFLLVLIRVPFAIGFWVICLFIASPVLNFLTIAIPIFAMIIVIAIAPGVAIGHYLSRSVTERAGATGFTLALIPIAGAIAAVCIGSYIAVAVQPIGSWQLQFASLGTATWACMWSFKAVVLDA